jgi:hypothetical protein
MNDLLLLQALPLPADGAASELLSAEHLKHTGAQ